MSTIVGWTRSLASRGASTGDGLVARFVRGASWSLLGATISRGATLVGAVVAARLLGSAAMGEFGLVQSTTALFVAVAGMGMGLSATKCVAEGRAVGPDRVAHDIRSVLGITAVSGLALGGLYLAALPTIRATLPPDRGASLALTAGVGLVVFGAIAGTGMGVLAGLEAFRTSARVAIARGVLATAMMVAGAAWRGVVGGVVGMVVAEGIGVALILAAIRRETIAGGFTRAGPAGRRDLSVLWRAGLPTMLGSVAILPAIWVANLLLVRDGGGYAAMGLYAAASKWSQAILFLPSSIAGIVLPMLANRHGASDEAEYRGLLRLSLAVNLGVTILPAAAVALAARPLMRLCGAEYEAGWPALVVLAIASVPTVLNNVLGQGLVGRGAIWTRAGLDALLAVTLVVASFALIPGRGAAGMATAHLVAFGTTILPMIVLTRRPRRGGADVPVA